MKQTIWELLEIEPKWGKATKALYEWSLNCDNSLPFKKFLDLIGYSEEYFRENSASWNKPSHTLGYKELGKLADALSEYADNSIDVERYITQLLDAEAN